MSWNRGEKNEERQNYMNESLDINSLLIANNQSIWNRHNLDFSTEWHTHPHHMKESLTTILKLIVSTLQPTKEINHSQIESCHLKCCPHSGDPLNYCKEPISIYIKVASKNCWETFLEGLQPTYFYQKVKSSKHT